MLKLRRLKVDKFRSLARGAELRFSDGINVLLGQNGTGKTTLLELISMVVRSDFSSLAKEEFAFEYELAVDEGEGAVVRVQNDRQAMDPLPEPFGLQGREVYRPSAEVFGGKDGDRLVKYDTEHGLTTVGQPSVGPAGIPSCLDPAFLPFFVAQVPLLAKNFGGRLMKASTAHRFDESLDMLKRVVGRESLGDFIVWGKQQWMPNIFARSLLPFDLVANIFASYEPNKPEYSFTQSNSSFLAALKELMGFSSSDLRVDVTAIHTDAEGYATVHLGNLSFRFGWGDGRSVS
jgi:energy-coupling factor transporter ATP-binding protein EcfA2